MASCTWLCRHPVVPAGFRMKDTAVLFLAPFAKAQEVGRDPREDQLSGVDIC